MRNVMALLLGSVLSVGPMAASAQDKPAAPAAAAPATATTETPPLPPDSKTSQATRLPGRTLAYSAVAGALTMRDAKGQRKGDIAFVSYALETRPGSGVPNPKRPITFVFNGGPGSASVWLHLGMIGPKRVAFGNEGDSPSKPVALVDNPETWLDFTDLVFIDPVGTGWSRPANDTDESKKQFWGQRQDIEWMARFIQQYLARNGRLSSPKFLVGESYGGFRAPLLAHRLQTVEGVGVSGLVMISPIIDFGLRSSPRNAPMTWVTGLPSMAAAALEQKTKKDVDVAALAEAEKYATGEFMVDILRGRSDPAAVQRLSKRVAELTGLDPALVTRMGGRVDAATFARELRRDEGLVGSVYDVTSTTYDPYPGETRSNSEDAILQGAIAPVTSAIVDYVANVLNWRVEAPYYALNFEVNNKWERPAGQSMDATDELRKTLALDRNLKILVQHGATDLQTPYMASRIILDQIPAMGDPARLQLKVYPGGHMFYTRDASRKQAREDAKKLYGEAAD